MIQARPPGRGWSRRSFVVSCSLLRLPAASRKGQVFPSEARRYLDPATEFAVTRFTDPVHRSWLPGPGASCVSGRGNFLVYSSERTGTTQIYRMDIKTGQNWLVTEAAELAAASLTLLPDERNLVCFDGRSLIRVNLRNYRARKVYEIPAGYERGDGPAVSSDGRRAAFVEVAAGRSRLRLTELGSGRTETVIEREGVLSQPLVRPRSAMIVVRTGEGGLLLTDFSGRNARHLAVAPGRTGPALFTRDGESLLYLNYPPDPKQLHGLRELVVDTGEDRLVARTSQFVNFTANRNASVFAGASGPKASPHILLLLRVTGRELTLCEHKSSEPARANLTFSPDSRWLFFQSDRDGKSAIYGIQVNEFVENTEA